MDHEDRLIANEIIEHSPSLGIRIGVENDIWRTLFLSKNISAYGYASKDFLDGALSWFDIVHPDDAGWLSERFDHYVRRGIDSFSAEYRIMKADGSSVWVQDNAAVIRDDSGTPVYADHLVTDYSLVKKITDRSEDNHRQQNILNEILQSLHHSDSDKALQVILDRTGVYLDISRVLLFEDAGDHKTGRVVYEWCNIGVASLLDRDGLVLDYEQDIPDIMEDLGKYGQKIVNYGDIPPNSAREFAKEDVVATAVFSIYINDEQYGFICFDECHKRRIWPKETVDFLKSVSRLASPVLTRKMNERTIRALARRGGAAGTPAPRNPGVRRKKPGAEKALREAVENDFAGFDAHYQPLVDARGSIVGAEALMRWTLPDGGPIQPADLIPLAESLDLVRRLDENILRASAALCREINALHPRFFVSVNVSARQFLRSDFAVAVAGVMAAEKVPLANLVLEVTESAAAQDAARFSALAEELRAKGARIAMDDFGTGYSSLGNLNELPLDMVKIDRSVIDAATTDAYAKSFIRLITELAHSIGKTICVEGVFTAAQLKYCRACGADFVQGFLLGEPMPADRILELCRRENPNRRDLFPDLDNASAGVAPTLSPGSTGFFAPPKTRR